MSGRLEYEISEWGVAAEEIYDAYQASVRMNLRLGIMADRNEYSREYDNTHGVRRKVMKDRPEPKATVKAKTKSQNRKRNKAARKARKRAK